MTDLRRHVPPVALTWDDQAPGELWRVVDGTLVFADVSGFTALTEKLSRRGRIGAEEIVETLNRVFGPMLRIAGARGGELLKFGGDALLFLFRGDDHTEQACDAAVEMRTALRQAAAVPTSVGRLSLKMSVGVHSGDIHLFLVGSPTRELLILGPGATATAEAEKAAEAGEIVVSADTAARMAPDAVRPRQDGELLLRRRSAHTAAGATFDVPEVDRERLLGLFPRALGEYLDPGIPDPEHRSVSIAFIKFSGTDALLAGPGPDSLAEALHRTVSLVEEALEPEGISLLATDLDSDGGKFFLGSGIPRAFDDNEGRMLRALRRIADADSPLPLQLGINRGHVFAAEVGIPERGAYTGMGDTTNTAARIMSKAPPGKLYAHPAVLEHSRTRFEVQPAGPFPMKGKAVPLLVYDVGEELGTREEATAEARLPFLGRDEEIATARAALDRALSGAGGVLTVTGATGMGKTRLLIEALEGLDVDHRIVVRAEPYGSASAYRVFRDPARRLLGIERDEPEAMGRAMLATLKSVAPDLLPMAPLLADVLMVDVPNTPEVDQLDPQYRPDRLADAVVRLMAEALPGRILLVAEEAHWADAASARLMERIAASTVGRPWAVAAVRRPDAGGFAPAAGTHVTLQPLEPEVIEQLVIAATESTPLRPHEIAAVVDRAQGNPLYVEEVTRTAVDAGTLGALPESVGAAMSAQIDLLPPHSRRILRYCAVLGRSFRVEVLRRTLTEDGLTVDPADIAGLAGFLEPDGPDRMRFRNSLVRDAAYEGLAYKIRARLHRAAGDTLERMSTDLDADAPTLALHFWRAGDATRTWTYAHRAADEARRAYANVDAAEHYVRALEVSRRVVGVTDAERADTWATLGDLRDLAGVLDGAIDAYRRAADLTGDPVARAEIMSRRARVHSREGAQATAVRTISAARRLLAQAQGDEARLVEARLDYQMAVARLGQDKPVEGREWAQRAVDSARGVDWYTLIRALSAMDFADQQLGRPGVGAHTREALAIAVEHGEAPQESVARANLGVLAFYAGRWDEAVEWLTTSSRVALEAGNDFGAAETDLTYADILIHQGRLDEAEEVLRRASRVLRASGIEDFAAHARVLHARIFLARGELDQAAQEASAAADEYREMGSAVDVLEADLVSAEIAIEAGEPQSALHTVEQASAAAQGEAAHLEARTQLVRGRALLQLQRLSEAAEAIAAGLTAAQEQDLPFEEALLLRTRSQLLILTNGGTGGADAQGDEIEANRLLAALGAKA